MNFRAVFGGEAGKEDFIGGGLGVCSNGGVISFSSLGLMRG